MDKLWIVGRGEITKKRQLGPSTRTLAMARSALSLGMSVTVVSDVVEDGVINGVDFLPLSLLDWAKIRPCDFLVITPYLPWRHLFPLLRSNIAFDLDCHGIGALESIETKHDLHSFRLFQGRRRSALRMRILLHRCQKVYLSIPEQLAFLGGSLFRESRKADVELASRLPEKAIYAPMGIQHGSFASTDAPPWVKEIGPRPVFLWGGGIWSWFDIPTLLKAFQLLNDMGSNAVLYFLTGTNPSGLASQDAPASHAQQLAVEYGILGKNVFFHDGAVAPSELPGFLTHCSAGIMSNPVRLESVASWRTRLLDLLWAGKPAIVSGDDPLSRYMERHGAAIIVPSGDYTSLANVIIDFCENSNRSAAFCDAAKKLAPSLDWSKTLKEASSRWNSKALKNQTIRKTPLLSIFRCLFGV